MLPNTNTNILKTGNKSIYNVKVLLLPDKIIIITIRKYVQYYAMNKWKIIICVWFSIITEYLKSR